MEFGKKESRIYLVIGYIIMYFIFTTVLYFILKYFDKIPENWNYIHMMVITLFIVLLGKLIKILLK